jgi:hypothetical protein
MNAESAIEKLQQITREKEVQKSEHKRRQEEEAKSLRKIEVEEELKRTKRSVEYSIVGCKVTTTFIIFFRMHRREGILCEDMVCANDNSRHIYNYNI